MRDFILEWSRAGRWAGGNLYSQESGIQFWPCTQYLITIFRPCFAVQTCKLDTAERKELRIEWTGAWSCTSNDTKLKLSALPLNQTCAYVCQLGHFFANSGAKMTCEANAYKKSALGKWKVPGVGCQRACVRACVRVFFFIIIIIIFMIRMCA